MHNGTNLKIFSGNSNIPLAKEICSYLDLEIGDALVTSFPDSESFVRYNENIRGMDVFLLQSTNSPANHNITVVIPFFGYARQDRKDQPRVPITSKLIANLLVAAGANRVLTMDLHAQQIQGFFDIPVDHLYASPVFFDYLRNRNTQNMTIFTPDVGGMKMASAYAEVLGCPLGFVAKRRTGASTVEATNLVGEVDGREILIVDDMTETAGTLTAAAKLLKERGAKRVSAVISHCVLNETGRERLEQGHLDELITTNSVNIDVDGLPITQLSVAPLLGEAIQRTHTDSSISSLFEIKGF
jgi:ribose-phosphate pyrophosphokinase